MLKVNYQQLVKPVKTCSCGCGEVIQKEETILCINSSGYIENIDECVESIKKFEAEVYKISKNQKTCNFCGKCCSNAPEISDQEINYFNKKYNIPIKNYQLIIPGKQCIYSDRQKQSCLFSAKTRPFQCRLLFCKLEIKGFEQFYNKIASFLGWQKLDLN